MSLTPPRLERFLTSSAHAPSEAREAVRTEVGADLEPRLAADLMVIVSELVTNGVLHGRASARRRIGLRVWSADRIVRVEVENAGGFSIDERAHGSVGGLGLGLVAKMSHRWGLESGPTDTTIVWAELAR